MANRILSGCVRHAQIETDGGWEIDPRAYPMHADMPKLEYACMVKGAARRPRLHSYR